MDSRRRPAKLLGSVDGVQADPPAGRITARDAYVDALKGLDQARANVRLAVSAEINRWLEEAHCPNPSAVDTVFDKLDAELATREGESAIEQTAVRCWETAKTEFKAALNALKRERDPLITRGRLARLRNRNRRQPGRVAHAEIWIPPLDVGGYHVLDEPKLGDGYFADVWKATDRSGRAVVLKRYKWETINNREARDRLEAAHTALRRLQVAGGQLGPGLVKVLGEVDCEDRNELIVALEYFEGRSLEDLVTSRALSTPQIAHVLAQVARALAYLHANGITHRDVDESNILVATSRTGVDARLIDYDLCCILNPKLAKQETDRRHRTKPESLVGRHPMPKKLLQTLSARSGGSPVPPDDPRADVYVLGWVALCALTGGHVDAEDLRQRLTALWQHDNMGTVLGVLERALECPPTLDASQMAETLERIARPRARRMGVGWPDLCAHLSPGRPYLEYDGGEALVARTAHRSIEVCRTKHPIRAIGFSEDGSLGAIVDGSSCLTELRACTDPRCGFFNVMPRAAPRVDPEIEGFDAVAATNDMIAALASDHERVAVFPKDDLSYRLRVPGTASALVWAPGRLIAFGTPGILYIGEIPPVDGFDRLTLGHQNAAIEPKFRCRVRAIAVRWDGLLALSMAGSIDTHQTVVVALDWRGTRPNPVVRIDPRFSLRSYLPDVGAAAGLAFSPDGSVLATAEEECVLRLWRMNAAWSRKGWSFQTDIPNQLAYEAMDVDVAEVAFSPDGELLAACDVDGGVHLFDVALMYNLPLLSHIRSSCLATVAGRRGGASVLFPAAGRFGRILGRASDPAPLVDALQRRDAAR